MKYLLEGQQTDRIKFRLLQRSDFDTWLSFFEHPDAATYLGMQDIGSPKEQCEAWFNKVEGRYKNNTGGLNVLVEKSSGRFVGQCGLLVQEVDGKDELEIGYSLLPEFWNKGYATEAARLCRDYAFEHNFRDSLISIIHVDNIRSEKVALKNDMRLTKQTTYRGLPVNIYRITQEEWEKMTLPGSK
ncbi:GNAT family N-acetyltransferase [Saccharicrinis sp. FJH62]|uniref:GNAT family N-acetyltransferase n=1 Tax=Saccharicrinis sp. FJH62 TaxID=3344657 RepID=UPI0035D47D9E